MTSSLYPTLSETLRLLQSGSQNQESIPLEFRDSAEICSDFEIGFISPADVGISMKQLKSKENDFHALRGKVFSEKSLILAAKYLGKSVTRIPEALKEKALNINLTFSKSIFGMSIPLTIWGDSELLGRVSIDDPALFITHLLEQGSFYLLLNGPVNRVLALNVTIGESQRLVSYLNWIRSIVPETLEFPHNKEAQFWHSLGVFLQDETSLITTRDSLQIGWCQSYKNSLALFDQALAKLSSGIKERDSSTWTLDPLAACLEGYLTDSERKLDFTEILLSIFVNPNRLEKFLADLLHTELKLPDDPLVHALECAVMTTLHGPEITCCGNVLPWFDLSRSAELKKIELQPESFFEKAQASRFWFNLNDAFPFDLGQMIGPTDVPFDLDQYLPQIKKLILRESVDSISNLTTDLLQEAVVDAQWIIPKGATIKFDFGPFRWLTLFPVAGRINFVLRTEEQQYVLGVLDRSSGRLELGLWRLRGCDVFPTLLKEIEISLGLLIAAIIRDFMVVEHREKVFFERVGPTFRNNNRGDRNELTTTVYLPRIKYSLPDKHNLISSQQSLVAEGRRSHFVMGHLRRVESPTAAQLAIAKLHRYEVPLGCTFVRPHFRGQGSREVIYRSRSALRLLFENATDQDQDAPLTNWFQFERTCYHLFKQNGFDVVHNASSRRGDRGIDIIASRGGDDATIWLIQCKCYSARTPVGPSVVRELVGAIKVIGLSGKGMIITTSFFSSSAIKDAAEVGIELVDGTRLRQMQAGEAPLTRGKPPKLQ